MGPTTMHIHIKGLPPNTVHGFHIHEYGDTFSDGTFAWSNTNKIVTNVLIACGTSLVFPRFSDGQRQAQGEHETNARGTRGEREGRCHAPKEKEKHSLTCEFSSLLPSDCLLSKTRQNKKTNTQTPVPILVMKTLKTKETSTNLVISFG